MPVDLGRDIAVYAAMVGNILRYDDEYEVSNVLVWREGIARDVESGYRLCREDAAVLARADERLAEAAPLLVERFPWVFEDREEIPRDYWWWRLGSDLHAREHARREPAKAA